jgi:putative membrane protein
MPNQLAGIMTSRLVRLQQHGKISPEQLLFINNELSSFTDICGACERVKNTPIPYSYSVFVKKFIFFYVMTLPFGYVFSLGYWVVPVVVFIFFVLGSLELIAEEIEEPFGGDANDLPTDKIALGIKKSVEDILI